MRVEEKRQIIAAQMRRTRPKTTPVQAAVPNKPQAVAVIGMSGTFPQCVSAQDFWRALDEDRSLIEAGTGERGWDGQWGGYIPDIRGFDAAFFNVLPDEAVLLDPRIRLLLMSTYAAIEDAGYASRQMAGQAVGVFIGAEGNEYVKLLRESGTPLGENFDQAAAMIANKISHAFDFRGASEAVDTMCSSGATALHRAVSAIRSGEIEQAVVGAANLLLDVDLSAGLQQMGQLSTCDTVRSFGRNAAGYLRGEGVATVLLKPLEQAKKDGDSIYAVIENTAVNYNGSGGMSIAAPNISAHTKLIRDCYAAVDADPRQVGYIEAQGMGNPLTDIAEWEAFNRALSGLAEARGVTLTQEHCAVGTLKPMTGHMHAASAMGALFKLVHALQKRRLYGILNFEETHPDLDLDNRPCRLLAQSEAMPESCRLVGLHSYGSGGNNAHILLSAAPTESPRPDAAASEVLIVLSAENPTELDGVIKRLAAHLNERDLDLHDLAHTLQAGRNAMPERLAFTAHSSSDLKAKLAVLAAGEEPEGLQRGRVNSGQSPIRLLTDDADAQALITGWIRSGRLNKLAELWCHGFDLTWDNPDPNRPPRRVHLPSYPFAVKPYWIPAVPAKVQPKTNDAAAFVNDLNEAQIQALYDALAQPEAAPKMPQQQIAPEPEPTPMTTPLPSPTVSDCNGDTVAEILAEILQLDAADLDPHKPFADYGLNSINGTRFMRLLEDAFDMAIPPRWMFDYPTITELTENLTGRPANAC